MSGTLVRLKGGAKRPAVMVIHENRGLNPHIRDVTRRFALEGFLAFGIDALSPRAARRRMRMQGARRCSPRSISTRRRECRRGGGVLGGHAESTGKVGAVGFCWGGGMVNQVAWRAPALAAGVAYYGIQPPADKVPRSRRR
jgi:carboxymethylenebutenolidase